MSQSSVTDYSEEKTSELSKLRMVARSRSNSISFTVTHVRAGVPSCQRITPRRPVSLRLSAPARRHRSAGRRARWARIPRCAPSRPLHRRRTAERGMGGTDLSETPPFQLIDKTGGRDSESVKSSQN